MNAAGSTQRPLVEVEIRRHNAVLEAINRVFREALTCETEAALGRACAQASQHATGGLFGFIGLIDRRSGELTDLAISDPGWEAFLLGEQLGQENRVPVAAWAQAVYGRVLREGKGDFTDGQLSRLVRPGAPEGQPSLRTLLGVALIQEGQTVGMIGVGKGEGDSQNGDWEALEALAPAIVQVSVHRRAERALGASEEQYRLLFAANPNPMWVFDEETLQFLAVNDAAVRHYGWSRSEFLALSVLDVRPPEDRELTRATIERHRGAREVHIGLVRHCGKDGTVREVEISVSSISFAGRPGRLCSINDVTERKQAERNQALLTDILAVLNRGGDLRVLIHDVLGLLRKAASFDAVALRLREGEDCPYFEQKGFSDEFLAEEMFLRAKCPDGSIVRDTEGKAVLECTCGLVLSGRVPKMPCFTEGGSFWSNVSRELLALPREADPRINPRNRCIHSGYQSVGLFPVRAGRSIMGLLQLNDRREGRFTPDLVAFYEAVAQNIGLALQRATAEAALRQAKEQLAQHAEELEKIVAARTAKLHETIAELEHFSYAIVHDMRAPLRAMQGFATLLEDECAGCERQLSKEYFRRIRLASNRMDQLISDCLIYSKVARQELPLEPVDLFALLDGLVETYPNLQPDKADIHIDTALPTVIGNQPSLIQCFSNLLGNAAKFAKPGAKPKIRVRAERGTTELPPQSSTRPPIPSASRFVRIWVEDDGIGIPKDAHQRIFRMFQRATRDREGTGIGLAIVHKVVERMNGRVGVESEEGKGSRFWVDLPLADHTC